MKRIRLKPRDLPARGGFSIPGNEIRDNTYALYSHLSSAARRLSKDLAKGNRKNGLSAIVPRALFDVQLYSRAVQVFASMAVEVTLNTYGLMRFGIEEFRKAERLGPRAKLLVLLDHDKAVRIAEMDPIVLAVERLADRRNSLVHQKSDETNLTSTGELELVGPIVNPPVTYEVGQAAIHDMETFFEEFVSKDPELSWLFRY